jgi:hypothetical protein
MSGPAAISLADRKDHTRVSPLSSMLIVPSKLAIHQRGIVISHSMRGALGGAAAFEAPMTSPDVATKSGISNDIVES